MYQINLFVDILNIQMDHLTKKSRKSFFFPSKNVFPVLIIVGKIYCFKELLGVICNVMIICFKLFHQTAAKLLICSVYCIDLIMETKSISKTQAYPSDYINIPCAWTMHVTSPPVYGTNIVKKYVEKLVHYPILLTFSQIKILFFNYFNIVSGYPMRMS